MASILIESKDSMNDLTVETGSLKNLFPKVKFDTYFAFISIDDLIEFKFSHNVETLFYFAKIYFREFDTIEFHFKIEVSKTHNLNYVHRYIWDKKNDSQISRVDRFYDRLQSIPNLGIRDFYDVAAICEKEKFLASDAFKERKNEKVLAVEKFMDSHFGQTEWAWKIVKTDEVYYYRPMLVENFLPEMFKKRTII